MRITTDNQFMRLFLSPPEKPTEGQFKSKRETGREFVCQTTLQSKDQTGADRLAFHTHLSLRMCLCSAPPALMENDSEDAIPAERSQPKGH